MEEQKSPNSVIANLSFLKWQDLYETEKPYEIYVDLPEDYPEVAQNNLVFEQVPVVVKDVRGLENEFKLETHGFQFERFLTKMGDEHLEDRQRVESLYLPEVEVLLKGQYPDAHRIFIFDWRIRKYQAPNHAPLNLNKRTSYLRPATEVHVVLAHSDNIEQPDQSPVSVLRRIQLQLPKEKENLLKSRVMVINVWRPLIDAVLDWPLALCDGRKVLESDLIECDNIRKHYTGSTMYVLYNKDMEWYYLSRQDKFTATLFKIFDSSSSAACTTVPHSGFELPNIPVGAEPRRSIEVRAMVFTTQ